VVVYKMGALEYSVVSRLVKVSFISLVNLVANKEVIKELIQDKAEPEAINQELTALLNNESYRNQMLSDYDSVYKILDTGSASDNTARLMLEALNQA
ncbi:MAG: lipid-A-disaccharide synthase, partial [Bacteroidetes bacterium]|nr:lipid-A-disaccharide synthase [Bacteroidota bacterium]